LGLIPFDGTLPVVVCPQGAEAAIKHRHAPRMVGEVLIEHPAHLLARYGTSGTQRMHGSSQARPRNRLGLGRWCALTGGTFLSTGGAQFTAS
jgi:hypothetical protein